VLSNANEPLIARNQYVIDLTSDKNIDYVVNRLKQEFSGVKVDYLKWDYNRYLTEASGLNCSAGEVYHRQVLGSYKLFFALKDLFKGALFENCAGGGGRFDLGMLYFSPQVWASDNTDPYERLYIQYGTSYAYPPSAISCHFTEGKCTSGRPSSFEFRYNVASFGAYGYELNVCELSDNEKAILSEYSSKYREDEQLVLSGDLYRLISPESNTFCAYIMVSKDKNRAKFNLLYYNKRNFRTITIYPDFTNRMFIQYFNYNNTIFS
jgi:alpha-galactosidase